MFTIGYNHLRRGEANPSTKLRVEDVKVIFKLAHDGDLTLRRIAKMYGVHWTTIADVKTKRSWAWLWKEQH